MTRGDRWICKTAANPLSEYLADDAAVQRLGRFSDAVADCEAAVAALLPSVRRGAWPRVTLDKGHPAGESSCSLLHLTLVALNRYQVPAAALAGHPTGKKVLGVRADCAAELFDWESAAADLAALGEATGAGGGEDYDRLFAQVEPPSLSPPSPPTLAATRRRRWPHGTAACRGTWTLAAPNPCLHVSPSPRPAQTMASATHYELLGLGPNPSAKEIRAAFRRCGVSAQHPRIAPCS
jgi:hypothetical protein